MKPLEFEERVQCKLECMLKLTVKGVAKDYREMIANRAGKELPFCEFPDFIIDSVGNSDTYDFGSETFSVCDIEIRVFDPRIVEALKVLTERQRNNVLMFYFLGMSDTEIAECFGISRAGAYLTRREALKKMKPIIEKEE